MIPSSTKKVPQQLGAEALHFFRNEIYSHLAKAIGAPARIALSEMRSSSLYLAVRSEREADPVLICPQPLATARWAMVTSSVSPER